MNAKLSQYDLSAPSRSRLSKELESLIALREVDWSRASVKNAYSPSFELGDENFGQICLFSSEDEPQIDLRRLNSGISVEWTEDLAGPSFSDDFAYDWTLSKLRKTLVIRVKEKVPGSLLLRQTPSFSTANRVRVILEPYSSLVLLEQNVGSYEDPQSLMGQIFEVDAKEGSILSHAQLALAGNKGFIFRREIYRQEQGSQLLKHQYFFDQTKRQDRTKILLQGDRSMAQGKLFSFSKERNRLDQHFEVEHRAKQTASNFDFVAIANEVAQVHLNGLVKVEPQAVLTEASQKMKGVLLSDRAGIETRPKLEIECHEVQVAHGAAVSDLSREALYYLRSRGLSRDQAQKLLLHGLLQSCRADCLGASYFQQSEEQLETVEEFFQ